MKHTPGPWRAEFAEYGGYDCMTDAWQISGACGGGWPAPIATVDLSHYGQSTRTAELAPQSRALAEADARLIAAAPDLLASLKNLLTLYTSMDEADLEHAVTQFADARFAITRAEGVA